MTQQAKKHQAPEFVRAAVNRRASGAAGPHRDGRTRRQGHRASARAAAATRNQKEHG